MSQNVTNGFIPQVLLSLLYIGGIRTVSPNQFLCKLIALIETFGSNFDAVFEVVEFVLKDLKINFL